MTPGFAAAALVAGRALPSDRFSVFSFVGEGDFSTVDTDRRVEVAVLVAADEVPFSFGFAVAVRLVGFAGALKNKMNYKKSNIMMLEI